MINWQGWYLPVVSWSGILDREHIETLDNVRIAVVKNLHKHDGMPYFALVAQGFPRLVSVTDDDLADIEEQVLEEDDQGRSDCLLARLRMQDKTVDLPALPALGAYISGHLQGQG